MSMEHQFRKAVARCLSLLRRYHDVGRTAAAKMAAEVEVVIGWLLELDLPSGAAKVGVLGPVEARLLSQYGREAGRALDEDFVEAFGRAGMPLVFGNKFIYNSILRSV